MNDVERADHDARRQAILEEIGQQLVAGYAGHLARKARRRRTAIVAILSVAAMSMISVAGLAAARYLAAPSSIKSDIAAVDEGLPADLQLNPDVANAHAVAEADGATLWGASLPDGGYCAEISTDDSGPRGAICRPASEVAREPIAMTVSPLLQRDGVVIGGRVTAPGATSLRVAYPGGDSDAVSITGEGYFIFLIPSSHSSEVRQGGFSYSARSASGATVANGSVPADWNEPARDDSSEPIAVMTRSDASDFTKLYGIEGHVGAAGAVTLELSLPDGTSLTVPLHDDGTFSYDIPPKHVGDFMRPQHLIAEDGDGKVVASTVVAAVAWWRSHNR